MTSRGGAPGGVATTARDLPGPDLGESPRERAASRAITRLAVRLVRRGTALVALTVAGMSAFVVVQYRSSVEGSDVAGSDVAALAALAGNPAVRTLFGTPYALDDAGGFTVWRTGTPLAVLVAVWAVLLTTRVTRGEEEAGRWALLLAGPLPLHAVLRRHLAVLVAAHLVIGAALTGAMLAAGTEATGAVMHGTGVALVGATFTGVALIAAQVMPERRAAARTAGAVVAAALLTRMVADGVDDLSWLRWVTPFGLLAGSRPYGDDRPLPLLVLVLVAAATIAAGLVLGRRRDAQAGFRAPASRRRPRTPWMRSPLRFMVLQVRRALLLWAAGLAAYFGLVGGLAAAMTRFLADNPRYAELAADAGVTDLDAVRGYAAALLGLLALPIGAFAAGMIFDDAEDETTGRLTMLFARPLTRTRWAATHAALAAVACLVLALAAATAFWVGTVIGGSGPGLGPSLAGALNAVPVMLLCVGAALFALGWVPRAVFAVGALPALGGYLLLVLADTFDWPGPVRALSPFAHVADVPAAPPDLTGAAALLAVAAALAVAGIARYTRRDLRG